MLAQAENNKKILTASPIAFMTNAVNRYPAHLVPFLIIYALFIFFPLILYTFRSLDNNRLLSWYWSISQQDLFLLLGILSITLLAIAFLARLEIPEQKTIIVLPMVAVATSIPFWHQPEMIIDNVRYFSQAKYLEMYGISYYFREWGNSIFAWTDLPLVPFIYGMAFKFIGEERAVVQIIGSLFFSGTVLTTYLLGKNLWGHQHGSFGAILLLGIPYIYNQVPLMLVDIPAMFFLSLALLVTMQALRRDDWTSLFFAVVTIVMAMSSKYSIWLMLSVIPMLLILRYKEDEKVKKIIVKRLSVIISGVLTIVAVVMLWKFDVIRQQLSLLFTFQMAGLGRWQESNVSSFFFHIHPLITFMLLISLVIAIKKRDYSYMVVAWLPVLMVVLEIKRIRYLIPIFPMIALMAAYCLAELNNSYYKRFIAYGTAFSAFAISLIMNIGFLQNTSAENIKLAGEYLNRIDVQTVEVMVLPQQKSMVNPIITIPALDYYTNKTLKYRQEYRVFPKHIPSQANKSSVRFTWEYALPSYYEAEETSYRNAKALAIIYSDPKQLASRNMKTLLQKYNLSEKFKRTTGVFRFQTMVNIYEPI